MPLIPKVKATSAVLSKTTRKPIVVSKGAKKVEHAPPHRLRKFTNYNVYVRSILKQTHAGLGLKQKSIEVLNTLIVSLAETMTKEAVVFKGVAKRRTLSSSDVRLAVRIAFPPALSKHVLMSVDNALAQHQHHQATLVKK